jgi:hypothetical protein
MAQMSVGWTLATFAIVLLTTPRWGLMGFAVGACIPIVAGNALLFYVTLRLFPEVRLWPRIRAALVGGVMVGVVGRYAMSDWAFGPVLFPVAVVASAVLFALVVFSIDRSLLRDALKIVPKRNAVASPRPGI